MKSSHFYKTHVELLKDECYLLWRLAPQEEVNKLWAERLSDNPGLRKEVELADTYLRESLFVKRFIESENKKKILEEIMCAVEQKTEPGKPRKNMFRSWQSYAAAVCMAGLIGLAIYKTAMPKPNTQILITQLEAENIQLVASGKTILFDKNIDILIDHKGVTKIQGSNQNESEKIVLPENAHNKLIVPYGKRSKVELSDGSRVWLNAGSVVEFPSQFTGNRREIRLISGEMYIEVMPDTRRAFYVHTSGFNVKVHGTKFNVSAYYDSPQSVVLVEGSVSLQAAGQNELFLSPDEQALYTAENGSFHIREADANRLTGWKNGYLEFNKTPMEEVLRQIGRHYNLSFEYDKNVHIHHRTCTGKIYLSDNPNTVITTVALLTSTRYEKENDRIYITNESDKNQTIK